MSVPKPNPLKRFSHVISEGVDRAPARAMLKGIGFTEEDMHKPFIGIANTVVVTMPCNFHLREIAQRVKEGVRAAGGTPFEFNSVAISAGITMPASSLKAAPMSR